MRSRSREVRSMARPPMLDEGEARALLDDLALHLDDPPANLVGAVRAQLREPSPVRFRMPRIAVVGVAAVVVAALVVTITPSSRRAVADWLGIDGVSVEQSREAPSSRARRRAGPREARHARGGRGSGRLRRAGGATRTLRRARRGLRRAHTERRPRRPAVRAERRAPAGGGERRWGCCSPSSAATSTPS